MKEKLRKFSLPKDVKERLTAVSKEGEKWAPHPDYPDFYGSSLGRIASLSGNRRNVRMLKVRPKVELTRGTRGPGYMRKQFLAHRFVWECFYGTIKDTRQIVFKNGDPEDRRLENLSLLPPAERIRKARAKA